MAFLPYFPRCDNNGSRWNRTGNNFMQFQDGPASRNCRPNNFTCEYNERVHNNVMRDSNIGRGLLATPHFQDRRPGFIPRNNREFNGNPNFTGRALISNSQNNQYRNNIQQLNSWQEGSYCVGQNSWQGNNCGGQNNWQGGCAGQNNFINFQNCRQDDRGFVNDISNHQINSGVCSNISVGRGRGKSAFRKNKFVLDRYGAFHHEQSVKKRISPRKSYLKRIGPSRFSNAKKESSAAKSNGGDSNFTENSNYGVLSEHLEENSFPQDSRNSPEKALNNLGDQDNCKELNEHFEEETCFNFVDDCSRENSFQTSTDKNHVKESSIERYKDCSSVKKDVLNTTKTEELSERINTELLSVRYRSSAERFPDKYSDSSERHEHYSGRSKRKPSSRRSAEKYYDSSDLQEYRDRSRVKHCPSRSNVDSYQQGVLDVENSLDRSNRGQYSSRSNSERFPSDPQRGKREDISCRSTRGRYQKGDFKVRGRNKVFPLSRPYSYRSFHSRYRHSNNSDIRRMPHKRPHDRSHSPESSSRKKGKFENIENEHKKRTADSSKNSDADKSKKRKESSKLKRSSHASSAGSDQYMKLEKTNKHSSDHRERGKHHRYDKLKKVQRKDSYLQGRNRSPSNAKKSRTCNDKIALSEIDDTVIEKGSDCVKTSVERSDKDTEKGTKGNENLPDNVPVKSLTNVGLPTDDELKVETNVTSTSYTCISESLPIVCEPSVTVDNVAKSSLLNKAELMSSEKETNSATADADTISVAHLVTISAAKDQPSSNITILKKVELIKKNCVKEIDLNSLSEVSDMSKQSVNEQEIIKSSEALKCLSSEGSTSLSGLKYSTDSNAKAVSIANNQFKKVEQILCRNNELNSTLPKIQKVANASSKSMNLEAQKSKKTDSKTSTGEKVSTEQNSHLDVKDTKYSRQKSGKSGHKSSSAKHSAKNTKLSAKKEVKKHSSSVSSKSGKSFDKEKSSNDALEVLSSTEINGTKSSLDEKLSNKPSDETPKSFRVSSSNKDMLSKSVVESVRVAKSSGEKVTMRNENCKLNKLSSVDEETLKCSSGAPVKLSKPSSVQEKISKQSCSDSITFIETSSIDQESLRKNSGSESLKLSKSLSVDKETLIKNNGSESLKLTKPSSLDKETLGKNSGSESLTLVKSSSVDKETFSKDSGSKSLKVSKMSSVDKETLSKNSGSESLKVSKSSSVDKELLSKNSGSESLKVSKTSSVDKETFSKDSGSESLKGSKTSSVDKETFSKDSGSKSLKVSKTSSVDKETLSKNSGSESLKVSKTSSVDKETLSKNSGSESLKVSKSSSVDKETLSKNSGSESLTLVKSSSVDQETLSKNSGSESLKLSKYLSFNKETLSTHNEPMNISKLLSVSKETVSNVSNVTKKTKPSITDSSSKTSVKSTSVLTKHSKSSNVVKEANKSGSNVTGKKMDKNAKSSKFLEKDGHTNKSQTVLPKRLDKMSKSSSVEKVLLPNSSKNKSSKSVDACELFSVEKESQRLESEKIRNKNAKCEVKEGEQKSQSGTSRGSKNKSESLHNVNDFDDMLPQLVHKSKRRDRKTLKNFVCLDTSNPGKSESEKNIKIGKDTEKVLSSDSEQVINKQHSLNVTDKESNEVFPEFHEIERVNKQAQVVKAKKSDTRRASADTVLKNNKKKSKALLRKCHSQDGKERTGESSLLDQSLFMEKCTNEGSVRKEKVLDSLQNKDEGKSLNLTEEKKYSEKCISECEEVVSADDCLYSENFSSDDCEANSEEESDAVKGVVRSSEITKTVTSEGKSIRERNFFDDFVLHEIDNSSDLRQEEDKLKKQKLNKMLSEEENDMKDINSNKNGSLSRPHCHVLAKSMSDKSEKNEKQRNEKVFKELTKGTSESRKRKHSGKENFDNKRKNKKDKSEFLVHELPGVLSDNVCETRNNVREIDRSVEGSVSELSNTTELSESNLVPLVMSTPIAKPALVPSKSVQVSRSVIKDDDLVTGGMVNTHTEGKHVDGNNCISVIDKTEGLLESKLSSMTNKVDTNNSSSFSYLSSFENISDPEDEDNCNGIENVVEIGDSIPSDDDDDDDCNRLVIDFGLSASTSVKNSSFNKVETNDMNPVSSEGEECGQEAKYNTCDLTFLYGKPQSSEDSPVSTSESGEEINSKEFDEVSEKSNSISSNCSDKNMCNMLEQVTERVKHPSGCVLNSDEEEGRDFDNCSETDTSDENGDSASNNRNLDNKNKKVENMESVNSELSVNCSKDHGSKPTCKTNQTCNSSGVKSPHQTEEREGEVENPQMASSSDSPVNELVIPKSEPLEYESNSQYSNTLNVMSGKPSHSDSSKALYCTVRSEDGSQSPDTKEGSSVCNVNQQESNLAAGALISPSQIKQEKGDSTDVTDKSIVCSENTDNTNVQNGGECAISNVPENTLIDRSHPSCASVNETEDTIQETVQETVNENDINLDIDEDEIDDNDIRLMIYIKGVPQSPWTPMPPTPRVHSQSDEEDFEPVSVLADLDSSSHLQKSNQESQCDKENAPSSNDKSGCVPRSQPSSTGSVSAEDINRTPVCAVDNSLGLQGRDEVVKTMQYSSGLSSTELCTTVDKVTNDKTSQTQMVVQASDKNSEVESMDNQCNERQGMEQTIPKDTYNCVSENADSEPSLSTENSTVVLPASCINQLNEILCIKETKNNSRVPVSGTSKPKTQMSVPEWAAELTPEEISAVEEVRKKSDVVLKFMRSKFKGFSNSLYIDLEHVKIYNCGSCFSTRAYYFPQNMSRHDWRCLLCLGCRKGFSPLGFACHTCPNTPGISPSLKLNEYETLRRAFVKVSSSSNNFDQAPVEDAWRVLKAAQMIEYQHCASVDRTCTISHKTLARLILQTNAYNPKVPSSSTQNPKQSDQVETSVSKGSSTLPGGVSKNAQPLVSQKDVLLETEKQGSTAQRLQQVFVLQGSNAGRYISQQPTQQGTNAPVLAGAFQKTPTLQGPVEKSFQPQETLHQESAAAKISAYERPTAACATQPAHQIFTASEAAGGSSLKSLPYRAGQQGLSAHDITAQSSQVRNRLPEGDHSSFALNTNTQNILQQPNNTKTAHSLTDTQPTYPIQKSSTKQTMLANLLNINSVNNHTTTSTNPGYATQAWTNTKSNSQMTHGPSNLSTKETHSTNTNQEYLSQQNYITSMQLQNVFNAVTPTSSTISARNPFEISSSVAASNLGNISNSHSVGISGGGNFVSYSGSSQQQFKVPDSGNVSKKTFGANLGSTNSFGQSVIGKPVPQDNVMRQLNHKNQEDSNLRLSNGQLEHYTAQIFNDVNPNPSSAVLSAKQPTLQQQTGQFAQPAPVSSEIHRLSGVHSKNSRVPLPHVLQQKRQEQHIRTDNHGTVLAAEQEYVNKTQNQIPATMIPCSTQQPVSTNNLTGELRNSMEEPSARTCNSSPGHIATNQNSNQQPVSVFRNASGEHTMISWESPSLTSNSNQEQLTLSQNSGRGPFAQDCTLGLLTKNSSQGQSTKNSSPELSSKNYDHGQSSQNYGQGQSIQNSSQGQSTQNYSQGRASQNYCQGQLTQNSSQGQASQNYSQGQASQNYSQGQASQNYSQGQASQNYSQGQASQNYSQGQATQNYSQGQATQNYSQGQSTQNCSQGQASQNYSQGQASQNYLHGQPSHICNPIHSTKNSSQGQSVQNCGQGKSTQNSSQGQPSQIFSQENYGQGKSTQNYCQRQSFENYGQGHLTQNSSQGRPTQHSNQRQSFESSAQGQSSQNSIHGQSFESSGQGQSTKNLSQGLPTQNSSQGHLVEKCGPGPSTQNSSHGQTIQNSCQELAPGISNPKLTTQTAGQELTTSDDTEDETPANKSTNDLITEMDDIMKDFQEGVNRQVRAMTRMQSLVRDTIDTMDRNQTSYQEEIAKFKEKQEKTEKTFKAALETIKTYMNKE